MSRLESFLRRLAAQRDCLEAAAHLVARVTGPVFELGLGNGRTYDHLRQLLPDREIFVFEREVAAHPDCVPDPAHLILGDIRATLPWAGPRIGPAALAHLDLGTGDAIASAAFAAVCGSLLVPHLRPGAIVVGDQEMAVAAWRPLALPAGVGAGRYFMWRVEA